ncbi:MAG TPA: CBS domain-containing protein, partial [Pseudogracilibacillus sp.]|nr:CBS domain-containing protein [Pseudogracilibacillus sp.]
GHSGYPVVNNGDMVGMITRRDLDKANHHGLGHAPVKAYMSTELITIDSEMTLEEIQQIIIEHNIGRLPVLEDGKLVGIVTRTNIIEKMHEMTMMEESGVTEEALRENMASQMKEQLPADAYALLQQISQTASQQKVNVFLIGGIVRDIFLKRPNDDIDITVEGDGIQFAKQLQADYGGEVVIHESFGTATWEHPEGFSIDVTTSRLEYYDRPASLPDVETSTLDEDLQRRDFTINAMAICLTDKKFGKLVDPFRGQQDLLDKKITILHNLSFVEDPTRVLRAVRFETRFQFLMDKQTEQLALHSIDQVRDLSAQRIVEDMKRIFKEKHPIMAMERLFDLQFWQQFKVSEAVKETVLHQAEKLEKLFETYGAEQPAWFDYFLLPFYEANELGEVKRFALTRKELKLLQELTTLGQQEELMGMTTLGPLHEALKPISSNAILFYISANDVTNEQIIVEYVQKRQQMTGFLSGDDLIQAGFKPGETFSRLLLQQEIAILEGEITSKEEALNWLKTQK